MTVYSFNTQYNTVNSYDNLLSYLQTHIIPQILSIGGEKVLPVRCKTVDGRSERAWARINITVSSLCEYCVI